MYVRMFDVPPIRVIAVIAPEFRWFIPQLDAVDFWAPTPKIDQLLSSEGGGIRAVLLQVTDTAVVPFTSKLQMPSDLLIVMRVTTRSGTSKV